MKSRAIRHRAEYLAVRAGLDGIRRLPFHSAIRLSQRLADAAFLLAAGRRRIAVDNLLRAGITDHRPTARDLARRSFRHFSALLVETLHADHILGVTEDARRLEWHIHPDTQALLDDPQRSFILAAGHLGNWEIGAQALARRKPVAAIARPMNNPYVDAYLRRINPRRQVRQIPKHGDQAFRMLDMIRPGEVLGLMIDQHARQQAIWLDFFGRPAASYTAVALLPLILRIPLCFGHCIRTGNGRFSMALSAPLPVHRSGNRAADIRRIMLDLNRQLEDAIRAHPDQYLWAHRRWRQPPPALPDPATKQAQQ